MPDSPEQQDLSITRFQLRQLRERRKEFEQTVARFEAELRERRADIEVVINALENIERRQHDDLQATRLRRNRSRGKLLLVPAPT